MTCVIFIDYMNKKKTEKHTKGESEKETREKERQRDVTFVNTCPTTLCVNILTVVFLLILSRKWQSLSKLVLSSLVV